MGDWPKRECKTCGWKTTSTSTLDYCIMCKDKDGLRPRHFLTRDKDEAAEQPRVAQKDGNG